MSAATPATPDPAAIGNFPYSLPLIFGVRG